MKKYLKFILIISFIALTACQASAHERQWAKNNNCLAKGGTCYYNELPEGVKDFGKNLPENLAMSLTDYNKNYSDLCNDKKTVKIYEAIPPEQDATGWYYALDVILCEENYFFHDYPGYEAPSVYGPFEYNIN